jgi:prophage regulatory protein
MILRFWEVCQLTGLSRSTIYDAIARGDFPAPLQLTPRAVGWPEEQIAAWLKSRRRAQLRGRRAVKSAQRPVQPPRKPGKR